MATPAEHWVSDIEAHTRLRHTGGMVAFSSSLDVDLTDGVAAFASINANLRGYRPVPVTKYAIDLFNASLANRALPEAPQSPALRRCLFRDLADFALVRVEGVWHRQIGRVLQGDGVPVDHVRKLPALKQ